MNKLLNFNNYFSNWNYKQPVTYITALQIPLYNNGFNMNSTTLNIYNQTDIYSNTPKNFFNFLLSIIFQKSKASDTAVNNSMSAGTWSSAIGDRTFFSKAYIWDGIIIGEQKSAGVLKKVYKKSFISHFWNILSSPVI